jgi:DNA repair exonuclease SbcCD ATPase subunit
MITIKNLTIKNFLSVGAVTQTVDFSGGGLTLVLGENLDLGGSGSRNGVGKSTLFNALSYALYGQAITNIKKDNLINTINKKNMVVSVEFEVNSSTYRIERGRKPNFFKYYVNDKSLTDSTSDEAQGENKDTQKEIDQVLGLSWSMFRHIVCLNTYTEPFLSMAAGKQREIIEELLGITLLSQKADNLKELIKITRQKIEQEEFRIHTVQNSNQRILNAIQEINTKIARWDHNHQQQIQSLSQALAELDHLDVEAEIAAHKSNAKLQEITVARKSITVQLNAKRQHLSQSENQQNRLVQHYTSVLEHNCPMCGQQMHNQKQAQLIEDLETQIAHLDQLINQEQPLVSNLEHDQKLLDHELAVLQTLPTVYDSIDAAYDHKNSVRELHREVERLKLEQNPNTDQLSSLNDTLQDVSYDEINELTSLKDHQEFLYKLLTSKESFIRKRIIDQNLAYLNHRLNDYLTTLGISHAVKFQNDLSVEINYMGQDMDFAQLSRGESTRVILALSWSFRDIFENMTTSVNFMGIDELVDVGIDTAGVEKAIEILKGMARDRNKSIFLISHKEELIPRVSQILSVIKESGFTRFSTDYESV